MKKTSKLKSKLCAWFLVCATVVTTLTPSSSMVFAENNNTPTTETEFSTLSVKSGEGGEISVELPDGQTETASNGNDITVEVETGSTIKATVNLAEGYKVATYRLTTDSGDSEDIETYDSFSFELTEDSTLEATYSVLEEVEETPEVTNEETTTEETEPEVKSTEPETEDTTVPVEETTPESEEETVTPDNTETEETLEDSTETKEGSSYVGVSEEEQAEYEEGLIPEIEPNYTKTYSASDSISTFSADNSISPRYGDTTVEEYGSVTLADASGLSREGLLWWLGNHVSDNYYLSTPYNPGWIPNSGMSADYRNPNGDCEGAYGVADKPGVPGMNCTGFVWHALTMAGGSNIPALSGWVTYLRTHDVQYRTYTGSNTTDILNTLLYEDDYLEVGDVIWMWDANAGDMRNGLSYAVSNSHHVGIYIGSYFDESNPYNEAPGWFHKNNGDKNGLWHSTDHTPAGYTAGNMISNITPKTDCYAITVVKTGAPLSGDTPIPTPKQGDVTLKKSTGACFKTHPQQHKCTFKLIIRPIYILTYMILDLLQVI